MKSVFASVVTLLLLGALANSANAGPIVWSLSTLDFDTGGGGPSLAQGGTASGFFVYDAGTNTYSDWSILVSGFGSGFSQANALATPATSTIQPLFFGQPAGPSGFGLSFSSDQALLWLSFTPALSGSGGVVDARGVVLDPGNVYYSWYAGGAASASVVPEALSASLVLGGIGFCALFMALHRRRTGRDDLLTRPD